MASPASAWLSKSYPWTKQPLITNAPMSSYVSPELVLEVTRAGGLGFLGAGYDVKTAATRLHKTRDLFGMANAGGAGLNLGLPAEDGRLPVGLGVLCFTIDVDAFVALLKTYRPIAVWLFAANNEADYAVWTAKIREVCDAHVWIQTNSVGNALDLARNARPDVLVMQGSDAGGHGPIKGAGIVSLVPETVDVLAEAGFGHIPVIAAGGIVDGRGVAAAFALGAVGVTLGTRFLASDEVTMTDKGYQNALLEIGDGGQTTTKSQIFDDVLFANGNIWPASYDGRGLTNAMVVDEKNGVSLEDARKLYAEDKNFKASMAESRAVAWAGTGVGLVKTVEPAFKIVTDVRESALKIMKGLPGSGL